MNKKQFLTVLTFVAITATSVSVQAAQEISDASSFNQALKSGKPTVVKFYSTTCPHCRKIAGFYESLSGQYGNVQFLSVNIGNQNLIGIAQQYGARGVPHFVFFDAQGNQVNSVTGANQAALKAGVSGL